jgi:hypothetical protein
MENKARESKSRRRAFRRPRLERNPRWSLRDRTAGWGGHSRSHQTSPLDLLGGGAEGGS